MSTLFNKLPASKSFQSFSLSLRVVKWWRRRCQQCWQTNYICLWNNEQHQTPPFVQCIACTRLRLHFHHSIRLEYVSGVFLSLFNVFVIKTINCGEKTNIFGKWYGCQKSPKMNISRKLESICWLLMILFWNRMCSWNHRLIRKTHVGFAFVMNFIFFWFLHFLFLLFPSFILHALGCHPKAIARAI